MIPLRMGDFDACIDYVLGHEGGYVNHPDDPVAKRNGAFRNAPSRTWRFPP